MFQKAINVLMFFKANYKAKTGTNDTEYGDAIKVLQSGAAKCLICDGFLSRKRDITYPTVYVSKCKYGDCVKDVKHEK